MSELMLVPHSSTDVQIPVSFPRLAQEPACERQLSLLLGRKKANIYGKQKTINKQRDQGDAQGRLGLIPSTKPECKTMALPGFVSTRPSA